MVEDPLCTSEWVATTLVPLLTDPDRVAAMGKAAASTGRPAADEALVDLVLEAVATDAARRSGPSGRRPW